MSNTQPLYDIQGYSDNELYDILDLVNPSDRELEAKILMEIHKYENINTKSARKLAIFFDEIYNHFFETEEDVIEGFDSDGDGEYVSGGKDEFIAKEKYRLQDQDSRDAGQDTTRIQDDDFETTAEYRTAIENRLADATSSKDFFDSFDPENATGKEDTAKTTTYREDRAGAGAGDSSKKKIGSTEVYKQSNISPDNFKKSQIGYTRELDYARGKLNPIMKETIKRIISIDSQYRSDKRTFSTDFTFNLSEPLKDVISLKLYSVQIPYTWYTIGKAYGNNFFYFKGRTPGIDTDTHDIKIEILAGNYKPDELITTVNTSIDVIKGSTTDISLGNTQLSYNPNTSLTTSVIDLKKSYNESSYSIQFDSSMIPNYLGFIDTEYDCRTIRSNIDTYDLTDSFNVTENNNYFTVNVYQDNSTTVNNSFDISITPNTYTRASLITAVNTVLSNETRLTNTNCSISDDNTYIDMSLQLTRAINGVNSSTKTEVVFYDQQHYTVDLNGGIFTNVTSTDLSGNIGGDISGVLDVSVITQLSTVENVLLTSGADLGTTITDGTYTGLTTTSSGNGNGAELTIVAIDNLITSVTVDNHGSGYAAGDTLTVDKSHLAGRTTDLIFTLAGNNVITQLSTVENVLLTSGADLGTTITDGTYSGLLTKTSGGGSGATLDIVALENIIIRVDVDNEGSGYAAGDTLTVDKSQLTGRTTDLIFTLVENNLIPGIGMLMEIDILTSGADLGTTITDGTYTDLSTTTSGGGSGATLDIVALENLITSVNVNNMGSGYAPGDTLTVDKSRLAGRTTDLIFTLAENNLVPGILMEIDILTSGADLGTTIIDGTYTGLSTTTSGNGNGATLDIVATTNLITSVTVDYRGSGYAAGDTLTVDKSHLAGRSTDLIFTLAGNNFVVSTIKEQPICTIKTTFHNGGINTNYNNQEIIHTIQLDNAVEVEYSLSVLYSIIESTIKNYQYNGVNIFAGTNITTDGEMNLKINADDKIWTNANSCFGFENTEHSLNEILSELEATEQSGNYTISTIPYVHLIPNTGTYNDPLFNGINDLSFSIPRFGSKNLTQYIDVINESISAYDLTHNNEFNSQGNATFDSTTTYPSGTHAYLQNQLFQMYFNVDKIFDETMYIIDFTNSIFFTILKAGTNNSTMFDGVDPDNQVTTNSLAPTYTSITDSNSYAINSGTIIFTIRPRNSEGNTILNGNEKEGDTVFTMGNVVYTDVNNDTQTLGPDAISFQVDDIINLFIRPAITNYKDPLSGRNTFGNIVISQKRNDLGFDISLQLSIKKTLSAKNYDIYFRDMDPNGFSWNANLYISNELTGDNSINTSQYNTDDMSENYTIYDENEDEYSIDSNQIDSSGNILDVNGNILDSDGTINNSSGNTQSVSGQIIYTAIPNGNVKISGTEKLISQVGLNITQLNNTFSFKAIEDGVATTTNQNDIIIKLPVGSYFRDTLIGEINSQIAQASSTYSNISGTKLELRRIDEKYRIQIIMNVFREYSTSDFNLVFFDDESFATCVSGASSIQNTTWDTTIGWIMGFREYTTYDMSARGTAEDTVVDSVNGNEITILGDTGLSTNLYNYFLICLDDFNQSHLNDGLITITNSDTTIPLPSYANRSNFVCDPVTGEKVYSVVNDNVTNRLTEKQIYATQVAANSTNQDSSIGTSVSTKSYGSGPFVTDVFGLVPMKVSGLQNGSSYVEFGGTLQNQERSYFGPVNINRMSVKLVTDRGNLVDLNKANWSFSLICETLNKLEPGT